METVGPEPNIYTYNTVTRAFAEDGRLEEAINILSSIQKRGLSPDRFTFTTLLMACGRTNNSKDVSLSIALLILFYIIAYTIYYILFYTRLRIKNTYTIYMLATLPNLPYKYYPQIL
jgi:pentatricopeptide repeat protein